MHHLCWHHVTAGGKVVRHLCSHISFVYISEVKVMLRATLSAEIRSSAMSWHHVTAGGMVVSHLCLHTMSLPVQRSLTRHHVCLHHVTDVRGSVVGVLKWMSLYSKMFFGVRLFEKRIFCYLEHLRFLRLGRAKRLMSWGGVLAIYLIMSFLFNFSCTPRFAQKMSLFGKVHLLTGWWML